MIGIDYTRADSTWADGYGTWHALVWDGLGIAERNARKLIRAELNARQTLGRGYRVRLVRVATHGDLVEYRERDHRDD